jgi:hypothetical protein
MVGRGSPIPSLVNIEVGITLVFAPRSARALLLASRPIEQGIVKLPGSSCFLGSLFRTIDEHSSL